MIEDAELRTLFQAESEEHLQSLETGLLHLEAEPRDVAILETVFRAAHSLKGSARMLGVVGLETLAHHFEDELGSARHGHTLLSAAVIERLYRGLDAMRRLAREAVAGDPAQVDLAQLLAQLRGEEPPAADRPPVGQSPAEAEPQGTGGAGRVPGVPLTAAAPAAAGAAAVSGTAYREEGQEPAALRPEDRAENGAASMAVGEATLGNGTTPPPRNGAPGTLRATGGLPIPFDGTGDPALPVPSSPFAIETIRVEPQRLDALMTRVGELTVTTTRVGRGLAALSDMAALWEEWSRDAAACRLLPGSHADGAQNGAIKQLARFHEREQERLAQLGRLLGRLRRTADEDVTWLNFLADELEEAIRGMRLLPLATIFNLFPRLVRDLSREQGKEVQLVIEGGETTADKRLLEELKDPLMHMIRNAIDHGIEPAEERERQGKPRGATLTLRAYQTATRVVIEVADDGRGLDAEAIRRTALQQRLGSAEELAGMRSEQLHALIFAPGFSTSPLITDVSGRGVGLDVVRANVERLKGTIQVESVPGAGSTFRIQTRITLATTHVLLVRAGAPGPQWPYALPVEFVQETFLVAPKEIFSIEGRPAIRIKGQSLSVARLADLLELPAGQAATPAGQAVTAAGLGRATTEEDRLPCILLAVGQEQFGVFADALLDEQEVMLKPLAGLLKRVRNVSGATILSTGEICMVLNPPDLLKTMKKGQAPAMRDQPTGGEERRKLVLLAEDSLTTRTQEKRILESAGYEVVTAVDGADAFSKLSTRPFDAVVSDVQMPNMDGLALVARIRQDPKYRELPILLVTSLASEEDRRRGIEVGANAYITKGTFEQKVLLETLRRLV